MIQTPMMTTGRRVDDCGDPLLLDRENVAELGLPHHQAAEEQREMPMVMSQKTSFWPAL